MHLGRSLKYDSRARLDEDDAGLSKLLWFYRDPPHRLTRHVVADVRQLCVQCTIDGGSGRLAHRQIQPILTAIVRTA